MKTTEPTSPAATTKKATITIDRTLKAPAEKVWKMWTTKEGIEKWWGPEGFESVVRLLDVRVGGRFEIVMTAVLPQIVEYLKSRGMDASSVDKGDYTELEVNRRIAYGNAVDFVPGVAPYVSSTTVDLTPTPDGGTRLVVATNAMHDDHWTKMKQMGWEQQLDKLVNLMA